MPSYSYGLRNQYRPSSVAPKAYGWSNRPPYNRADVPVALLGPDYLFPDERILRQQFAYEWFQSGQGAGKGFGGYGYSNPPFLSGAAGRLHPSLRDADTGVRARILRGYIRRADYEVADDVSKCRLYFMFNPETIQRDYVSYLNQAALDPFNTVYESGNLVAPPSIMDFSFSLVFDRQEEATQKDHPGVFVDYQYFDLVVRNVIPQDPNQTSNTLPDNGVMMVNPRDITVVFSPQLTVQGRPLNAQVHFEKFTHRMVPTRMTITLAMRVLYIGPVKEMKAYTREQLQAEASIPINTEPAKIDFSLLLNNMVAAGKDFMSMVDDLASGLGGNNPLSGGTVVAPLIDNFAGGDEANTKLRMAALIWAKAHVYPTTFYSGKDTGYHRYNLPISADCSGLVTEAYTKVSPSNAQVLGWTGHPGTSVIIDQAQKHPTKFVLINMKNVSWQYDSKKDKQHQALQNGDLLIKDGHIAFFDYYGNDGKVNIFQASPSKVGAGVWSGPGSVTWYLLRPTPIAATSAAGQTTVWEQRNQGQFSSTGPSGGGGGTAGSW
jgi:hypothetical protein